MKKVVKETKKEQAKDKARGIKENSKADMGMDWKEMMMVPSKPIKKKKNGKG